MGVPMWRVNVGVCVYADNYTHFLPPGTVSVEGKVSVKWTSRPGDHTMKGDIGVTVHPVSSLLLEAGCESVDYISTSCQVLLLQLLAAKPDNVISRQTEIPLLVYASCSQSTYPPPFICPPLLHLTFAGRGKRCLAVLAGRCASEKVGTKINAFSRCVPLCLSEQRRAPRERCWGGKWEHWRLV